MSMLLISEKLLESELTKKNGNELYLSYVAKELEVIKKLDIAFCNMTGDMESVSKRLEGCETIIMPKGTYDDMYEAKIFRSNVKNLLQESDDEPYR
ncbi:MAG: hypothetical protein LUE87_06460 [Lachnospiraceae bacterium]|nr:hypothetical protein [Lachnospiraceae bacterium]